MGKYLAAISNSFKKNAIYRANTFIMMFSVLLSFGVLFYFWSSIYRQGNQIGTYSFGEIISYYIFIAIFELIFTSNTAYGIGEEIKNGQITNLVLKPMRYLEYKFAQSVGTLLYRFIFLMPVIVVIVYLMRNYLTYSHDNFGQLEIALLVLLAYVLNFLVYYIVGILSFWMIDNSGFYFACLVVISFMQGQWIPLDLLPKWFTVVESYLPFKYLFFVPVQIASGRSAFYYYAAIIPLLWCVGLYFFAQFLYKKGIKKYEGYGI
ncbi:MAG: ABC-2 family transporter protein [Candidatus Moranbacteria bacterium]|nr:ABC-2 family transporter protein [Candidatus Moranbacteria bacterium]